MIVGLLIRGRPSRCPLMGLKSCTQLLNRIKRYISYQSETKPIPGPTNQAWTFLCLRWGRWRQPWYFPFDPDQLPANHQTPRSPERWLSCSIDGTFLWVTRGSEGVSMDCAWPHNVWLYNRFHLVKYSSQSSLWCFKRGGRNRRLWSPFNSKAVPGILPLFLLPSTAPRWQGGASKVLPFIYPFNTLLTDYCLSMVSSLRDVSRLSSLGVKEADDTKFTELFLRSTEEAQKWLIKVLLQRPSSLKGKRRSSVGGQVTNWPLIRSLGKHNRQTENLDKSVEKKSRSDLSLTTPPSTHRSKCAIRPGADRKRK